jgi:transposase
MSEGAKTSLLDLLADPQAEPAAILAKRLELDQEAFLAEIVAVVRSYQTDLGRLRDRVNELLRAKFGRTSEAADSRQVRMFDLILQQLDVGTAPDDMPSVAAVKEATDARIAELEAIGKAARKAALEADKERRKALKGTKGRQRGREIPKGYEVVHETILPDTCTCGHCGGALKEIREDVSWTFEREVRVFVKVVHRPVMACKHGHGGPVTAPMPDKPVDKGHLGFSLAAWCLYLRFSRQIAIGQIVTLLAAESLTISEGMIHTLATTAYERLEPVIACMKEKVLTSHVANCDDTPCLIVDLEHPNHRRIARLWVAVGDEKWVWFFNTPTWKAADLAGHLKGMTATLQGDGYGGYDKLAKRLKLRQAGCLVHLRRKLLVASRARDLRADAALALIALIYRVEKLATLEGLDVQGRLRLRRERSLVVMDALDAWAEQVAPGVEPGSPLGQAWTYLRNQREALREWLTDGQIRPDNNAAERRLRRPVIGKKLWLFHRGDFALGRTAGLASIFQTAQLHGADELRYFTWLLTETARRTWSPEAAVVLLPDAWLAREKQRAEQVGGGEGMLTVG